MNLPKWISDLRKRRLGSRRIQSELLRNHAFRISRATLAKVLRRLNVAPLSKSRILRKYRQRYERPIPGERLRIDTCKIATGLYQYTAVDDCTRIRCLALFDRRTAANSLIFLEQVIEEMPFPIQRIQTDRGLEFFAFKFQEKLKKYAIKFRPIKPRSPHLNGKVERSQRTDLEEFYSTVDLKDPAVSSKDRKITASHILTTTAQTFDNCTIRGNLNYVGARSPVNKKLSDSCSPMRDTAPESSSPLTERAALCAFGFSRSAKAFAC